MQINAAQLRRAIKPLTYYFAEQMHTLVNDGIFLLI